MSGGCDNLAGSGSLRSATCPTSGAEAVLGGSENIVSGLETSVVGGESNSAKANNSSILGGEGYNTTTACQAIPAAPGAC